MAKKIPVKIWLPKKRPDSEPNPQKYVKLAGVGYVIKWFCMIEKIGWRSSMISLLK